MLCRSPDLLANCALRKECLLAESASVKSDRKGHGSGLEGVVRQQI